MRSVFIYNYKIWTLTYSEELTGQILKTSLNMPRNMDQAYRYSDVIKIIEM